MVLYQMITFTFNQCVQCGLSQKLTWNSLCINKHNTNACKTQWSYIKKQLEKENKEPLTLHTLKDLLLEKYPDLTLQECSD